MREDSSNVGSVKVAVGLALFALTSAIVTEGLFARSEVYQQLAYDELKQTVGKQDYAAAHTFLEILESPFLASPPKRGTTGGTSSLLSIAEELAKGRVNDALEGMRSLKDAYPEVYDRFSSEVGSLSSILEEIKSFPEREAGLLEEQKRSLQKLNLLREDLQELFGLPSSPLSDMKTYTEGVLEGLPVVDGVPPINDLVELREILPALGGGVKIEGPDAATLFSSRIEGVRSGSLQALKSFDDAGLELGRLKRKVQMDLNQARLAQERLLGSSVSEALERAKPDAWGGTGGWTEGITKSVKQLFTSR